jgi:hypothetical protein
MKFSLKRPQYQIKISYMFPALENLDDDDDDDDDIKTV